MPGKIARNPLLAERARKLRAQGLGFRQIAKTLNEELNAQVSHMAVKSFFDAEGMQALGFKQSQTTTQSREELKQEILNTTEQLKRINEEMWELYKEIKRSKKDKLGVARMNMLDKILRQLEFNARQLGRISNVAVNITQINYVDFAVTISNYLEVWEKKGYIKILKPITPPEDAEAEK